MSEVKAEKPNADSTGDLAKKLCADAQGLGPLIGDRIAIGHVDQIVGEGGAEKRNLATGAVLGDRDH
jgi:hypothetical protein